MAEAPGDIRITTDINVNRLSDDAELTSWYRRGSDETGGSGGTGPPMTLKSQGASTYNMSPTTVRSQDVSLWNVRSSKTMYQF